MQLREVALGASKNIAPVMNLLVQEALSFASYFTSKSAGREIVKALHNKGWAPKRIMWNMFGCGVGAVATQGQALAQVVDFYLRPENDEHLKDLKNLATVNTSEADDLILGYILEAGRVDTWVAGVLRQKTSVPNEHDKSVALSEGDIVFLNLARAMQDPQVFPNPEEVNPRRPKTDYIVFGNGFHESIGEQIDRIALPTMFKEILKLRNLRRAPGSQGQLKKLKKDKMDDDTIYVSQHAKLWPFPSSMLVFYD